MYFELIRQMKKSLGQVASWLDKATADAQSKKFDPSVLLSSRLAPDQFPLSRQIQIACDTAKLATARLAGKDAPTHADTETTVDELKARLASVLAYLDSFGERDFDGGATRTITQPRWEGRVMSGHDYLLEHALPNFYFHLSHAYAILRHNGVSLGKRDFLGQLSLRAP